MFRNTLLLFSTLFLMMSANQALADRGGNNECPVGLVSGMTLDDEFGPGSGDLTQCLKKRHRVKVVIQVNQFTRAYALGNMSNMIKDYEITHGMKPGRDYEMVAVVHSGGGGLILKNDGYDGNGNPVSGRNQFQGAVETLISQGVKFYFCQNTTRGMIRANRLPDATETTGGATAEMIDGVEYTTAGVTSIADYQSRGYSYVQP
jgi:intracellular sulfur oxidation DsrE/DsrF family protein